MQPDFRQAVDALLNSIEHLVNRSAPGSKWLEVDLKAPDIGGRLALQPVVHVFDIRIAANELLELAHLLQHRRIRNVRRRLGQTRDQPVVLLWKETLGNDAV